MIDFTFPIEELEYFLLIMTRVTCFIYIAPFFSMQNTPNRVKIGLGFFISILLYYMTEPHVYPVFDTVLDMATVILKEAAAGLLIGLGANLCSSIVLFAGRVIDMEMGFAMANQMDPTTSQQMPHMATVQLPVDGILGRNVAEKVPVRVVHTLRLQAILTGHVLDEEASGTIFHRIVLIMRKYLLQFRTIDT